MKQNYIKLVVLGEGRVGKTSLTLRYCQGLFDDKQESTINASYLEKIITMADNEQVKLAIWDTAGQEKFNALAPMYYRDALGAVIVYDITYKESFNRVQKWAQELKSFAGDKIVIAIAGNKSDMENQRQINKEEAEKYAQQLGAQHFSTSAKSNLGVDEIFKFVTSKIVEIQKQSKMKKKKVRRGIIEDESNNQEDDNSHSNGNGKSNFDQKDRPSIQLNQSIKKPQIKPKNDGCC